MSCTAVLTSSKAYCLKHCDDRNAGYSGRAWVEPAAPESYPRVDRCLSLVVVSDPVAPLTRMPLYAQPDQVRGTRELLHNPTTPPSRHECVWLFRDRRERLSAACMAAPLDGGLP